MAKTINQLLEAAGEAHDAGNTQAMLRSIRLAELTLKAVVVSLAMNRFPTELVPEWEAGFNASALPNPNPEGEI